MAHILIAARALLSDLRITLHFAYISFIRQRFLCFIYCQQRDAAGALCPERFH